VRPDVIVIGGGPAGLTAAIAAARGGVPTLLVERRSFPIDKACGEGLLPNAVDALHRLGLPSDVLRRSGRAIEGIRYLSSSSPREGNRALPWGLQRRIQRGASPHSRNSASHKDLVTRIPRTFASRASKPGN